MKKGIVAAVLLMFAVSGLLAQEQTIVLGRGDDWSDLFETERVTLGPGLYGDSSLYLEQARYSVDESTDLLLHFDSAPFADAASRFRIESGNAALSTTQFRAGGGAAVFLRAGEGMTLTPSGSRVFGPGRSPHDFSIEFWMQSTGLLEGETVFQWEGGRARAGRTVSQRVVAAVSGRRLFFSFENVFVPAGEGDTTVTVAGRDTILPRTWHHHLLRYDGDSGMLEYLLDGTPQNIAYATASGHEDTRISMPVFGSAVPARLAIGRSFAGWIDELRISEAWIEAPIIDPYPEEGGVATTRLIDLGYTHTVLERIEAVERTPGGTDILYSYRMADSWTVPGELDAEYQAFVPGRLLTQDNLGRYLQIRAELLPDGTLASSPELAELSVVYVQDRPPLAPARVFATAGNGSVELRWNRVPEMDVCGYMVYFGMRPRSYFGQSSTRGASPVDAGDALTLRVDGLENGRLYYFSVVAYDSSSPPHQSEFSNEVSARPGSPP